MRNAWIGLVLVVACSSHEEPTRCEAPPEARVVMKAKRSAPQREPIAPWSLTASDGSGLQLVSVDARAVIEGPLAFTELHLKFHNAEPREREGTFSITLPARAAVSRFAMFEDGHYKEAEVVAKALARRAYDDALHAGIDPAILEKGAGNQFTAKVYPIAASSDKELVLSYSQELNGAGYVLPLAGLPAIDDVSVSLVDGEKQRHELHEQHWQPDRDFYADVATDTAVASGSLVAAAYELQPTGAQVTDPPASLALFVDTSASRAPGFAHYVTRVRSFIHALAARYPGIAVEVTAFDQESKTVFSGPAEDFGDAEVAALVERRADGASDLGQALAMVKPNARVAVIGDGVVTAGLDKAALADAVKKRGAARVDVILAGGIRDDAAAKQLVRTGARPGDVFDFDDELAPIVDGLGESVQVDVPVEVADASWFYPHVIPSVRAGTQVLVYAKLDAPRSQLVTMFGGVPRSVAVHQGTPAFVERAAARAEIEDLEAQHDATTDAKAQRALAKEIETRSIAARVVSSQATMIVLDNDREYARYGIDRNALVDILVVGADGLEQQHRTFIASRDHHGHGGKGGGFDDANIYGGLLGEEGGGWGTVGAGRYGALAHGAGGGRTASVPTIRIAQATAMGSLDKTFVRTYLQRHVNKIRYCYEKELLARPSLHGEISTSFTIAPDGTVVQASATGFDDAVAQCVVDVLRHIEFPASHSETVQVNYPFTFRNAGTPEEPDEIQRLVEESTRPSSAPPLAVAPSPTPTTVPETAPSPTLAVAPSPTPVPAPTVARDPRVNTHVEVHAPPPSVPEAPIDTMPRFNSAASALRGNLAKIMRAIARHDPTALEQARAWRDAQPTDVLAIIALGEALEAAHDRTAAARVYGSLIDLYPTRADYRRFAGERLERLGDAGRPLAVDTYRRAVADRPDQLTGHRLLAYALVRSNDLAGAFDAILKGVDQKHPDDRYLGADRVLRRDAAMIAAAYLARGGNRATIEKALARRELTPFTGRSTRVLLYWETDANDVDLHVRDAHGGHSWYSHLPLESGGELYADITTGYGPECFEIVGTPSAGPYKLGVHYYRQGPMGYGMGLLQIVRFDGRAFTFDDRPYVIMQDEAYVSLGAMR
jgi:tetratricopeptide (TPR) repeat protein